ncbi:MAG: glycerophosphodiester phosphodiesterase [Acidimicrobiales bacterium]
MTIVVAHRGASGAAPENTLEAFSLAGKLGADWVELDVRRSADDVLVVHHDAHTADGRIVARTPAAELGDDVPTLAEAFEAAAGMGVNVEIKNDPADPDYDEKHQISVAVAGLIAAYRPYDEALVSSFNVETLNRIRAIDDRLATVVLFYDPVSAPQWVARAAGLGHSGIYPYFGLVGPGLVSTAHAAGLTVGAWTVNDEATMAELVALGVDALITDHPDIARRVVDEAR